LTAAGLARPAAAQEATPAAGAEEGASFLFVQTFGAGSLAPKEGAEAGVLTLTADHLPGQTLYFSDRPERIVGMVATERFLGTGGGAPAGGTPTGAGFTPADPPNAALVAQTAEGEDILVVELLNPRYDEAAGTLAYDVRLLADYANTGLADLAARQADDQFASSFTTAHLFIDGCGRGQCWNGAVSMCVSCQCFQMGVQGCPCVSGTRNPCYDLGMNCEINPGSPPGSTGACWYP
jgi:hypothetical protein